jgi:hypothetical protein
MDIHSISNSHGHHDSNISHTVTHNSTYFLRNLRPSPTQHLIFTQSSLIFKYWPLTNLALSTHHFSIPYSSLSPLTTLKCKGHFKLQGPRKTVVFYMFFHWLVLSCKFRSICFAKFVRQIWTSSLHDIFT